MKTLSLSTGASGDGQSLAYTCTAPDLENKLLSQTSTLLQPPNNNNASPLLTLSSQSLLCPSLQPSLLSSTTSKLLSQTLPPSSLLCTLPSSSSLLCTLPSSSSLLCALPSSSSLLCTQNKLLNTDSPLISVPQPSAVSAALPGSSVLNRFVHGAVKKTDGEAQSRDTPSPMCCAGEDTTVHYSEDEVDMSEEESSMFVEEEESTSAIFESPDMEEEEVAPEESEVITLEFEEVKRNEKDREEMIKDNKYLLLNLVCCSLVNKSTSPGQKDWNSEDSVWTKVINLGRDISEQDPEFLLKVAVYTRQELNIRITANFLLALAANLTSAKCHVRRYFCAAVQLPSDWLEVVRIYSTV